MVNDIDISAGANLVEIENEISRLQSSDEFDHGLTIRISSDRRASYFKDIWCAIAVSASVSSGRTTRVKAWGLQNWSKQDDEDGFALSYPGITAVQFAAEVVTDRKAPEILDASEVRRLISEAGGVLGSGGRHRTVVELDPEIPNSTPLMSGSGERNTFLEFVRQILRELEIGAMARKAVGTTGESIAKGTVLEFLYELQSNAVEHGRALPNVRFLRLQKHLYPSRTEALRHSTGFAELSDYLNAQPSRPSNRMFNLVEASVSDFGPGILDGFLGTFAGGAHRNRPRAELLSDLLHAQLSSKSDLDAGRGIINALAAAREMDAFVSLRTDEFWLVMRGRLEEESRLMFRSGKFPKIQGTHWQLLLPDPTQVVPTGKPNA